MSFIPHDTHLQEVAALLLHILYISITFCVGQKSIRMLSGLLLLHSFELRSRSLHYLIWVTSALWVFWVSLFPCACIIIGWPQNQPKACVMSRFPTHKGTHSFGHSSGLMEMLAPASKWKNKANNNLITERPFGQLLWPVFSIFPLLLPFLLLLLLQNVH